MKKHFGLSLLLFALFASHASAYDFPDKIVIDKDFPVAKIGNEEIKMSEVVVAANQLNKFLKDNFVKSADWRFNYVREFVVRKMLEKYAVKHGFDKNEDIKYQTKNSKTQILSNAVVNKELSEKFNVTDADKEKYYEENKTKFVEAAKIKVRHIQLSDKEKTDGVLSRLKKGESFSDVAKEVSEDENTKNNGGLINGYLSVDMPPMEIRGITSEMIKELFTLKKDEISQLIEIEKAYHIFQIEEIVPSRQKPYSEVKSQIDFEAEKDMKDKIISQLIGRIADELSVTINETEIKKDLTCGEK